MANSYLLINEGWKHRNSRHIGFILLICLNLVALGGWAPLEKQGSGDKIVYGQGDEVNRPGAESWPYVYDETITGAVAAADSLTPLRANVSVASTMPVDHHIFFPIISYPDNRNLAKGVAWAFFGARPIDVMGVEARDVLGIGWYHNWGIRDRNPLEEYGVESVPVFWCDIYPSDAEEQFFDYKKAALEILGPSYDGYLLFLNEPDLGVPQCDRSPEVGAELYLWLKQNLPYAQLVGPMISHIDGAIGWPWLKEWREHVIRMTGKPPDVYAYSLHDYIKTGPVSVLTDSLYDLMVTWGDGGMPIWVTEYGAFTAERTAQMTDFFAKDPRIERFASFSPYIKDGWWGIDGYRHFYWKSSELTPVGRAFANYGN